jgi:hypothetical protein
LHVHCVTTELPLGELEWAGHVVHAALPVVVLYVPALQAVHVPPSGPVNAMLHVQTELPLGELELAGQVMQVFAANADTVVENVPAAQFTHALILVAP